MIALVLTLAMQAAVATAAPSSAEPAPRPVAAAAKPVEDKMECREQMVTGSHFSSRTCLHHSEWMRMHDESVEALARRGRDSNPGFGAK